jgi:hypothetical protein
MERAATAEPTGVDVAASPEAMTVADAAHATITISGQPVKHRDVDGLAWIQATIAAGVPADYGDMLAAHRRRRARHRDPGHQLRRLRPTHSP